MCFTCGDHTYTAVYLVPGNWYEVTFAVGLAGNHGSPRTVSRMEVKHVWMRIKREKNTGLLY